MILFYQGKIKNICGNVTRDAFPDFHRSQWRHRESCERKMAIIRLMIQIDDAGSGSFVGGTCIGVYRPETNEYYFDIIPVELYNEENMPKKLYLDAVTDIVRKAFDLLYVQPWETIEVCRGYMFESLSKWLCGSGYTWYRTHITGRVQEIVEDNFTLYTVRLGLPMHYIKYTRYPFHFHKLLRWVFSDFDSRIALCKVGWKCWQRIKDTRPQVAYTTIKSGNMACLRCGKPISAGERIKLLYYTTNKTNYIYLHPDCQGRV
jgi:hypothetical protein